MPEEEKVTRTIAIDRTRKIKFVFVPKEEEGEEETVKEDEEEIGQEGKEDERSDSEKITEERDEKQVRQ